MRLWRCCARHLFAGECNENEALFIRIAVESLGPVIWNAAVPLVLLIVSPSLGPQLDSTHPQFGSYIAFIPPRYILFRF